MCLTFRRILVDPFDARPQQNVSRMGFKSYKIMSIYMMTH